MINKKGFTLSEVMVAIGVLGVLAAMLVPAIMNTAPDNSKVMFKKAYYNLERSVNDMINDDVNYPQTGAGTACTDNTGTTVNCGFSYTTPTGNVPATAQKFCYLLVQRLNTVKDPICTTDPSNYNTFYTTDGIKWNIVLTYPTLFATTNTAAGYNGTKIVVDVNGDKKPNCGHIALSDGTLACTGSNSPDTFEIGIRYDGKLQINPLDTVAIDILENPTNNKKG